MSDQLLILKNKYNQTLDRNKKAEEYFQEHTVEECLNKKFKSGTALDVFNEVTKELSNLIIQIESTMGNKMTHYEKINGFKL
ncbi:hypothetical protein B0P06_005297 [Clostridium saccharoperbutylacetonicum]|uniref:Uncharacterized protein n=1 Tax=Clostridium saccharoperbutylacetonicum N1-4(HMT) TaxID=931276 RepID=M1MYE5_9CLOT|nr:hypothetical protein [Clostridium saccharoperbutylacetonicum]AGF56437.1 hypothetical protein Cspa_c26720 [Clostridium saccharoperbutylacetonicum N1-4(HMT)]NRT62818.1 hypothetical protein [Clostridium saccharoperbutylacetonicum]NSB26172.1 hypothetical protein [Clostridium saccharoperbutylacetonicum]NSB45526.1 hypothetical protein [Clostridium saccharoperbutylacetonicum]